MPMEENLQNDELERFFKNTFEEADQSANGDIPSDDVWLGIKKRLNATSAKTPLVVIFSQWKSVAAVLTILIVVLSLWGIVMHQSSLKHQVTEYRDTLDLIKSRMDDIERKNKEKRNTTIYKFPKEIYESPLVVQERDFAKAGKREIIAFEPLKKSLIEGLRDEKDLKSNLTERANLLPFKAGTQQKTEVKEESDQEQLLHQEKQEWLEKRNGEGFIPLMPLPKLIQEVAFQDTAISLPEVNLPNKKLGSKNWSILAGFGPQLDNRQIEQMAPNRGFEENESYRGYKLKLSIQKKLKDRFGLSTGISYGRLYQASMLNEKINFQRDQEQEVGDELRSTYVLGLLTPVNDGEIEVELNRPRNDPSPQNGKEINLELGLRRAVTYWSFPLILGYDLVKVDKTDLFVQVGLSWTFYEEELRLERIKARNLGAINHRIGFRNRSKQINNNFGELVLGLNWSRTLDDQWRIYIAPSLRRALQPIVENERVTIKNTQLEAQLGISYNF